MQLSSCLTCIKYIMTYYDSIKFVKNCKCSYKAGGLKDMFITMPKCSLGYFQVVL